LTNFNQPDFDQLFLAKVTYLTDYGNYKISLEILINLKTMKNN